MKKTSLVLALVLVMMLALVGTAMAQEPLTLSCESAGSYGQSGWQYNIQIDLINKTVYTGQFDTKVNADITETQIKWIISRPKGVHNFTLDRYTGKLNWEIDRPTDREAPFHSSLQGLCSKVTKQF